MKFISNAAQAESNALLLSYQNGDTDALAELYNRWNAYITKRITESNAFSCQSDIEDTASEVWILVQENAAKWDIQRSSWYKFLDYRIKKAIAEASRKRETFKRRADHEAYRVPAEDEDTGISLIEQVAGDEPTALDILLYNEQVETLKSAIKVCQFSKQTRQILRLRLQGLSANDIQSRLGINSRSQVNAVLSRAINQLRTVINPKTYEIRMPPTQHQSLASRGLQLAELCRKKEWKPLKFAKALDISPSTLTTFFNGERKPYAPVLYQMAKLLGESVYDIYVPPLTHFLYAEQGQQLWYARVRLGLTIQKLAYQIHLRCASGITKYETGRTRPPEPRLTRLADTLHAPKLLEIYHS